MVSFMSSTTKWFKKHFMTTIDIGKMSGLWIYSHSRIIGWMIVTTGIITVLPLIFEIKREAGLEELEKLQIGRAIAEGHTPQELAGAGMTSAIPPSVLS